MITIRNFLNKIKWDKNLNPDDHTIYYLDRISKTLKKVKYSDIIRTEGTFIIIRDDKGEEINIPMHRVRRVTNKKVIVWQR
jgi:uncharacterized protein (UPF0248 family)